MMFVVLKLIAVLLTVIIAIRSPQLGAPLFRRLESGLAKLAHNTRYSLILVTILGILSAASVSLIFGLPKPAVHDEFSYLLAADTFAHARLTNPTPPLWTHFETFHVLLKPTYMSKYPPGQGLTLAVGEMLCGLPIVGIWLANGVACAGLWWMLRAWMPPRWALLGGLLATIHLSLMQWTDGYWGGTVAVLGGALALGGFRWLTRAPSPLRAVGFGLGIAILVSTRPYEGMIVNLTLLGAFAIWMLGQERTPRRMLLYKAVLPLTLIIGATLLAIGVYNDVITGSPLRFPYLLYESTYGWVPGFLFQHPGHMPVLHHAVMRQFQLKEYQIHYAPQLSLKGFLAGCLQKLKMVGGGFVRPSLLALPLLTVPYILKRDRWMRMAALLLVIFLLAFIPETWMWLHYAAPIMAVVWLFVLQGLRYLRVWRPWHRQTGRFLMWCIVLLCPFSAAKWYKDYGRPRPVRMPQLRARILDQLDHIPGRHLVLVRYSPSHNSDIEWVYNRADINASRVVWAREMGGEQDRELLDYFKDRHIWLLQTDIEPLRLQPYPNSTAVPADRTAMPPVDQADSSTVQQDRSLFNPGAIDSKGTHNDATRPQNKSKRRRSSRFHSALSPVGSGTVGSDALPERGGHAGHLY